MTDKQKARLESLCQWLDQHIRETDGLSNAAMGTRLRLSAAMISKIRNHDPKVRTIQTLDRLADYYAAIEAKTSNPGVRFVLTSTAQKIATFCDTVRTLNVGGNGGVLTGPTGVGKTVALQYYTSTKPASTFLVRSRGKGGSVNALLGDIAKEVGSPIQRYAARSIKEDRVLEALQAHHLLIIDQFHELPSDCVSELMYLMDVSGCSIVLCGTRRVYDLLMSPYVDQPEQLLSRCRLRMDLTPPYDKDRDAYGDLIPREDLEAIARDWAPALSDDCVAWLHREANKIGLLRETLAALQFAVVTFEPEVITPKLLTDCANEVTHAAQTQARVPNWRR